MLVSSGSGIVVGYIGVKSGSEILFSVGISCSGRQCTRSRVRDV